MRSTGTPKRNGIDVVSFRRGERKDDRTQEYLRNWSGGEGAKLCINGHEYLKRQLTKRSIAFVELAQFRAQAKAFAAAGAVSARSSPDRLAAAGWR